MKQVIVVDEALRLPRGKLAAQVAHAALGAFLAAPVSSQRAWLAAGMPKVVVRCESSNALASIEADVQAAKLPYVVVRDAGHTVVPVGTKTCIGIGPADNESLDRITGALKLVG